jgi:integrase
MEAIEGQTAKPVARLTFDDIAQKVKDSKPKQSQANFKEMLAHFRPIWTGDIKDFKESVLWDYKTIAKNKLNLAKSTINRDLGYLRSIGSRAMLEGLIKNFTLTRGLYYSDDEILRDTPRKYYPNREERRAILKACREHFPRYYLWVALAICCGWRRSEIRDVRWSDFDWKASKVRIQTKRGQQDRRFWVKGFDDVLEALEFHKALLKKMKIYSDTGLVYPPFRKGLNSHGDPFQRAGKNQLNTIIKKLCVLTGNKNPITPHCFRKPVANELYQAGVPIAVIKEITGHTSLKTIY